MRKITQKVCLEDGTQARENRDMYKLLNHNIQRLLNQAERAGEYGFPDLYCNTDVFPDYSVFGDIQKVENLQRIWKARIDCSAVVYYRTTCNGNS